MPVGTHVLVLICKDQLHRWTHFMFKFKVIIGRKFGSNARPCDVIDSCNHELSVGHMQSTSFHVSKSLPPPPAISKLRIWPSWWMITLSATRRLMHIESTSHLSSWKIGRKSTQWPLKSQGCCKRRGSIEEDGDVNCRSLIAWCNISLTVDFQSTFRSTCREKIGSKYLFTRISEI